jgi:hypothetical protein
MLERLLWTAFFLFIIGSLGVKALVLLGVERCFIRQNISNAFIYYSNNIMRNLSISAFLGESYIRRGELRELNLVYLTLSHSKVP